MSKERLNTQILVKKIIDDEYKETDEYEDENSFFEMFSAEQILKNLNPSDEEIERGLVGGSDDGGCDSIYVLLNGETITSDQLDALTAQRGSELRLCVIQSKLQYSFHESVLEKWKVICDNLLDLSVEPYNFVNRYNEYVIDEFKLFRDACNKLLRKHISIRIDFYYASLGIEVPINVNEQGRELENKVKSFFPTSNVNVEYVGAEELFNLYNSESDISENINLAENPISINATGYIAVVNLGEYYDFITDASGNIRNNFFEANVRDYQGKNSVNQNILQTLENDTEEDFWWLNNGVTVLSSEIKLITSRTIELLNPEIVNGLQTSREIYNYFTNHPEKTSNEERTILIRFIQPQSEESRDKIILATNNQTNIPKSSLRVTDPIHLKIEQYMKRYGLYYDRRKNYYKNQKKKPSDIISVPFMAQCLISIVLSRPDIARARPSSLLTDDKTYQQLYKSDYPLEAYYNVAFVGKTVKHTLTKDNTLTSTERNDILFWVIYAVMVSIIGKQTCSCTKAFDHLKKFKVSELTEDKIKSAESIVIEKYKERGGNVTVAKSADFINDIDSAIIIRR